MLTGDAGANRLAGRGGNDMSDVERVDAHAGLGIGRDHQPLR
ncbi:hypothetical protein [Sphingomonas lenta]